MPATTAIKTDIRNEILRILREDITYQVQPGDVAKTIVPTAILFQKTRAQMNRRDVQQNQLTDLPGLLLCQPMRTEISETEWTNEKDEWHYHWLVQLIDSDLWNQTDRQDTWDKWIEQIASRFMLVCLSSADIDAKTTWAMATATGTKDIDEQRWVRDDKFIAGVEIQVRVSQPRGVIA